MEQENETAPSVLNKPVGNIEKKKKTLIPARITIVGLREVTEKSNGESYKVPILKVLCKHPWKPEPIEISKIKVLIDDKVITKTLWIVLDADDNIQIGSAVEDILKFTECETLSELEGKELDTVVESKDSAFLCLKLFN